MTGATRDVLLVEPYAAGSHAAWAEGYRRHSRHAVRCLTMPGRFWKWRMHGAAVTLARAVADGPRPDVVLASDMLDLAAFAGLARRPLSGVPLVAYFHESQLTYPPAEAAAAWSASRRRRTERRDEHYPFVNATTALAADRVVWNSAFHRDAFLGALPAFLRRFPDERLEGVDDAVRARSAVVPVGIDIAALRAERPVARRPGPPRILWNHRWEHDKGPDTFAVALAALAATGAAFEVVVLGESFVGMPPALARLREELGDRVARFGFAADRREYARWLWDADVCVSAARHEFFGVAVCEAVACGCRPLLPRRLAYPEIFPPDAFPDAFYEHDGDLARRLAEVVAAVAAGTSPDPALAARVDALAWPDVAPLLDDVVDEACGAAAVIQGGAQRG